MRIETEKFAPMLQALERIEAAAMAVDPVVIARKQNERMLHLGELALARGEPRVGAGTLSRSDIADVHHERERLAVEIVDQEFEALGFALGVGRIAHQGEADAARRDRLRRAAGEKNKNQGQTTFSPRTENVVCPCFQMP